MIRAWLNKCNVKADVKNVKALCVTTICVKHVETSGFHSSDASSLPIISQRSEPQIENMTQQQLYFSFFLYPHLTKAAFSFLCMFYIHCTILSSL